jgi:hypothetical protein
MKKPNKPIQEEEYHFPGMIAWSTLLGTSGVIFLLWFFTIGTILNMREWHEKLNQDFKEFQVGLFIKAFGMIDDQIVLVEYNPLNKVRNVHFILK